MTRINVGLALSYVKFILSSWKTYMCNLKAGTKCAQLIADLFLFCYERDFVPSFHKSKQYDLIDIFNNTSRRLS